MPEYITWQQAMDLVRTAVDETIAAMSERPDSIQFTTGTMASTTTVRLDDDDTDVGVIGDATAGARVLCAVVAPSAVYVLREL